MSSTLAPIVLGPSMRYLALTTLVHGGGIACVAAASIPAAAAVPLAVLALASYARDVSSTALRSTGSAVVAIACGDAGWTLWCRDGGTHGPFVPCSAWVTALGVSLRFERAGARGARRVVHVPGDAVGHEALRRLRVAARAACRDAGAGARR